MELNKGYMDCFLCIDSILVLVLISLLVVAFSYLLTMLFTASDGSFTKNSWIIMSCLIVIFVVGLYMLNKNSEKEYYAKLYCLESDYKDSEICKIAKPVFKVINKGLREYEVIEFTNMPSAKQIDKMSDRMKQIVSERDGLKRYENSQKLTLEKELQEKKEKEKKETLKKLHKLEL